MIEKIQIYISIIAAVAITVAGILSHASLYDLAFRLIIVIIVFYLIGIIVKHYLLKNVFIQEQENPMSGTVNIEGVKDGDILPSTDKETAQGEA